MGCDVWACKNLPTCVQVTSSYLKGGGEKPHRNDGKLLANCTAPHPTVQSSAREPKISRHHYYTSIIINIKDWTFDPFRLQSYSCSRQCFFHLPIVLPITTHPQWLIYVVSTIISKYAELLLYPIT